MNFRLSRLVLSTMLTFVLACACSAVTMQVTVGFDGAAKSSFWTPIAVELANKGSKAVKGTLDASQDQSGGKQLPTFSAEVNLPPRSKKLYHVYARLAEYGGDLVVTLSDGRNVIANKKVTVDAASLESLVVVSVGRRTSRLGFLSGDSVKVIKQQKVRTPSSYGSNSRSYTANIQVGSIEAFRLPDRLAAYEGVDCLVISTFHPSTTNSRSLKAICGWVASGGTLVVATGPNYQPFQNRFFDEMLPVSIKGAANLDSLSCLGPMGNAAFPRVLTAVTRARLKPRIGRPLAEQDGVPIVAERDYGAGRVIFLAFDHTSSPFRDWTGQAAFWKSILAALPDGALVATAGVDRPTSSYPGGPPDTLQDDELTKAVAQNHTMKAPSFTLLGLFLLGYVVALVPVNYFFLRRKRRMELAWATTPAIVLLFSIGAYAIGYSIKGGGLKMVEATFVECSSSARYGRVVTTASLFSPSKRDYDVESSAPGSLAWVLGSSDERVPTGVASQSAVLTDVGLAMWSSKNLQSVSGADLGGKIISRLTLNDRRVTGRITNRSKVALTDCCLVYGGNKVEIDDLGVGASVEADITYSQGMAGSDYAGPHPSIEQKLISCAVSRASGLDVPVLIGISEDGEGPMGLRDESPEVEAAAVYVVRLDYADGPTFRFDSDQIEARVVSSSRGYSDDEENAAAWVDAGGQAVFAYRIPVRGSAAVTELKITGQGGGQVVSKIYNVRTSSWDAFKADGTPVKNARQYVDANNTIKVQAAVKKGREVYVSYGVEASGTRN